MFCFLPFLFFNQKPSDGKVKRRQAAAFLGNVSGYNPVSNMTRFFWEACAPHNVICTFVKFYSTSLQDRNNTTPHNHNPTKGNIHNNYSIWNCTFDCIILWKFILWMSIDWLLVKQLVGVLIFYSSFNFYPKTSLKI